MLGSSMWLVQSLAKLRTHTFVRSSRFRRLQYTGLRSDSDRGIVTWTSAERDIVVRPATTDDVIGICKLYDHWPIHPTDSWQIGRILQMFPGFSFIGINEENDIVGAGLGIPYGEHYGTVRRLFVRPDLVKTGLGKKVMTEAIKALKTRNIIVDTEPQTVNRMNALGGVATHEEFLLKGKVINNQVHVPEKISGSVRVTDSRSPNLLGKLTGYDRKLFTRIDRDWHIHNFVVNNPNARIFLATDAQDIVLGYAFVQLPDEHYFPVFWPAVYADDDNIALNIFSELMRTIPIGADVILNGLKGNTLAENLASKLLKIETRIDQVQVVRGHTLGINYSRVLFRSNVECAFV